MKVERGRERGGEGREFKVRGKERKGKVFCSIFKRVATFGIISVIGCGKYCGAAVSY